MLQAAPFHAATGRSHLEEKAMLRIRPDGAVLLAAACLALTACTADKDAFYPETARGDRVLEQRALDRVPAAYEPVSVTMTTAWGRRGRGTDTDITELGRAARRERGGWKG